MAFYNALSSSRRLFSSSKILFRIPTQHFHTTAQAMVKDTATVIREFNELVNMEPAELKDWLTGQPSLSAGWPKEDGTGETIGHDSGRHIVDILSRNPTKDLEKYESKDVEHMRKVVSYCKRHLAQEESAKKNPNSKSAKSLKNWGHDPQNEIGDSE